ncbi:MAG: hypothetical protein GAK28_01791 [Luteibacter sp.]|uniref:hypothetical protein n=1 Tax=Luteibacter sp. TaxID=1886636 RepID=UPI001380884D|nr:hypothetical protein [Luteibacter sp.]KAF1007449.1 MAG: hypothetical protein GAK28_01791 [Luteibacter sp.]
MAGTRWAPRPLPEQVIVVAFPRAWKKAPWPAGASAPEGDFFIVQAASQAVSIPRLQIEWLTLRAATPLGPTMSRIDYIATDNIQGRRQLRAPVIIEGTTYEVAFIQQPGDLVQDELVRTLNCPLNLDCQIAIGFVADLIKKIPIPPIRYLVLVVAALAVLALGVVIVALRRMFAGVPEPPPLSTDIHGIPIVIVPSLPIRLPFPLEDIPAESQTIDLQTLRAVYWLVTLALQP